MFWWPNGSRSGEVCANHKERTVEDAGPYKKRVILNEVKNLLECALRLGDPSLALRMTRNFGVCANHRERTVEDAGPYKKRVILSVAKNLLGNTLCLGDPEQRSG